jgi:hypothetical protein
VGIGPIAQELAAPVAEPSAISSPVKGRGKPRLPAYAPSKLIVFCRLFFVDLVGRDSIQL